MEHESTTEAVTSPPPGSAADLAAENAELRQLLKQVKASVGGCIAVLADLQRRVEAQS